jgi:hypothetical protein
MRKQGYSDELIEQADAHNETEDEVLLEARSKFAALKADIQEGS